MNKSSAGGSIEGGIHDISIDVYDVVAQNQEKVTQNIDDDGEDVVSTKPAELPPDLSDGGALPEGFEEEELDIVETDNTAGTRIFLTKDA